LPELEQVDLGETDATTLGGLLMERLGRPAVVGDSITLPAKAGYVPHEPAAAHEAGIVLAGASGGNVGASRSGSVQGGGNGDGKGNGNGHDAAPPAAHSLKVTALKVMRTRIKLMKVEPVGSA